MWSTNAALSVYWIEVGCVNSHERETATIDEFLIVQRFLDNPEVVQAISRRLDEDGG